MFVTASSCRGERKKKFSRISCRATLCLSIPTGWHTWVFNELQWLHSPDSYAWATNKILRLQSEFSRAVSCFYQIFIAMQGQRSYQNSECGRVGEGDSFSLLCGWPADLDLVKYQFNWAISIGWKMGHRLNFSQRNIEIICSNMRRLGRCQKLYFLSWEFKLVSMFAWRWKNFDDFLIFLSISYRRFTRGTQLVTSSRFVAKISNEKSLNW